jgi:hypothetical protein
MIRSVHMNSCLAAQLRFMLFKGPGSIKKNFKIGGNVDELKAYRLIPLTPPPPWSFYTTFNSFLSYIYIPDNSETGGEATLLLFLEDKI